MSEQASRLRRIEGGMFVLAGALVLFVTVTTIVQLTRPAAHVIAGELVVGAVLVGLVCAAALPLLWVGTRQRLGRSDRRSRLLAYCWLLALVPLVSVVLTGRGFDPRLGVFPSFETFRVYLVALTVAGGVVTVALWNRDRRRDPGRQTTAGRSSTRTGAGTSVTETDTDAENADASRRTVLGVAGVSVGSVTAGILGGILSGSGLPQGSDRPATPAPTFDFEYDESSGRVTITLAGGRALTAENTDSLTVRYTDPDGTRRTETWANDGGEFPVDAGDRVTVRVEPGTTVSVVQTEPGGGETQTLGSFTVPS